MFLLPAYKNAGIFCYVEAFFDLALHICAEIAVAVEKILVLIAMAGHNIFNQRFRRIQYDFILIPVHGKVGKAVAQNPVSVLQSKVLIELFAGQDNSAVEALYKFGDFFHVGRTVGAAEKYSARTKDSCGFPADCFDIFTVEQDMVGNYDIKAVVIIGNCMTVKGGEGKSGIFTGFFC